MDLERRCACQVCESQGAAMPPRLDHSLFKMPCDGRMRKGRKHEPRRHETRKECKTFKEAPLLLLLMVLFPRSSLALRRHILVNLLSTRLTACRNVLNTFGEPSDILADSLHPPLRQRVSFGSTMLYQYPVGNLRSSQAVSLTLPISVSFDTLRTCMKPWLADCLAASWEQC